MIQLVILDRDGVINYDSKDYIKSPAEWRAIPGALAAIAHINQLGIPVCVATNQSGIARQYYDLATLQAIHAKMLAELHTAGGHIDHIWFCPHGPDDDCNCRKPKPGMILEALSHFNTPAANAIVIGDAWRDCQAGLTAGTQIALVKTGKGETTVKTHQAELQQHTVPVYADLAAAVNRLRHLK